MVVLVGRGRVSRDGGFVVSVSREGGLVLTVIRGGGWLVVRGVLVGVLVRGWEWVEALDVSMVKSGFSIIVLGVSSVEVDSSLSL